MNMYGPDEWDWIEQSTGTTASDALFENDGIQEKGIVFYPLSGEEIALTKSELQRIIDQLDEMP